MVRTLPAIWNYGDPREYVKRVRSKEGFPPVIITVAITGGVQGKELNPVTPETPEEQAQSTFECYEAGASVVHVHARDPQSGYADASSSADDYLEVNRRIRELCPDMIINNTTGGGIGFTVEQRIVSLYANPEMASLNLGPTASRVVLKKREPPLTGRPNDIVWDDVEHVGSYKETELFARKMLEKDIKPEFEMWAPGCVSFMQLDNLIDKGLVKPPYFVQFVMGSATMPTPQALLEALTWVPQKSLVSVLGVAQHQLSMNTLAILLGCHVRVGLEDNIYYKRGEKARSNSQLVQRVVRIAKELRREVASPTEAREMLGLSKTPTHY